MKPEAQDRKANWAKLPDYWKQIFSGVRFGVGIAIGIMALGVVCAYFSPDVVESGILYVLSCSGGAAGASNTNAVGLSPDTLYEATITYYSQIISVLIFVIGIAGVIAFAHIGLISRERAEDIAKESAESEVEDYFGTIVFQEYLLKRMREVSTEVMERDYGISMDNLGDIQSAIARLEYELSELKNKYDRHDDLLIEERERELADQEVVGGAIIDEEGA